MTDDTPDGTDAGSDRDTSVSPDSSIPDDSGDESGTVGGESDNESDASDSSYTDAADTDDPASSGAPDPSLDADPSRNSDVDDGDDVDRVDAGSAAPVPGLDTADDVETDATGDDTTTADNTATADTMVGDDTTGDPGDGSTEGAPPSVSPGAAPEFDVDIEDVLEDQHDDDGEGLFDDLLSGEPIFENKEVLRPSYTPRELPHRDEQINNMATILVAALRGETPSNILIYGKTGTGKTASAKYVSQELESTSQKYQVACEVEYINCEVTDTQYRVLAQLANTFIEDNREYVDRRVDELEELAATAGETASGTPAALAETPFADLAAVEERIDDLEAEREQMEEVPMTGWPTDRVYSTFFDAVDFQERVAVIMLDEIDKLVEKSGDDTLYNLSRMNSELDRSRVSIIGISNDLKFTDFLDPRVKSSLGEEEIVFPPYDANQLRDILQHRAEVAFEGGALSDDVIPLCAAFAALEHGDARRALDLLRTAGELAERDQADVVCEEHVRQAQDKIELDRVVEVVRTLPTQSKLVLYAILLLEEHGVQTINTGEVYNIYKRLCGELEADVLTQRRVTDLISELDMLGIVNAVVVSKGRYGRTKEISLSVPHEETEAVLTTDSRLADLGDVQPFVQSRFDTTE